MDASTPLILRCLGLTGSFETGKQPPACFGALAGDFDGQGLSFSALQWNIGQGTLQPLLAKVPREVMQACFGIDAAPLLSMLNLPRRLQINWARSIQTNSHVVSPDWTRGFAALGATPEWQAAAMADAQKRFDDAKSTAEVLKLSSDRAMALLFDIEVQNGGVSHLALNHILDVCPPF